MKPRAPSPCGLPGPELAAGVPDLRNLARLGVERGDAAQGVLADGDEEGRTDGDDDAADDGPFHRLQAALVQHEALDRAQHDVTPVFLLFDFCETRARTHTDRGHLPPASPLVTGTPGFVTRKCDAQDVRKSQARVGSEARARSGIGEKLPAPDAPPRRASARRWRPPGGRPAPSRWSG